MGINQPKKPANRIVTVIPMEYLKAISVLYKLLEDKKVQWSITGNLGEVLSTVHVEPDCIEVITSKESIGEIHQAVQVYGPTEIEYRTEALPRSALIDEKEYSVKMRSFFFEFNINDIKTKVYSDLQYQIANWDWGDKIEFTPDYILVVGERIAVVPLELKLNLYLGLGWVDRAAKIREVIDQDENLKRGFENIKSIVGIGDVAAIALLHLFIKYPDANRRQIVSLTGLEPVERESGSSVKSRPKISKAGSKLYRGSLFMSVLVAVRYNDEMQAFFGRLKANGKHTTLAQIAVMRKLIVIAHSLYKNNEQYDPEKYRMAVGA